MKKLASLLILFPVLTGCGGSDLTGPSSAVPGGPNTVGAALMSVSPQGGTVDVPPGAPVTFHFGGPMAAGMEQYFDLHMGGLNGPTVPMTCAWSDERTTLTCNPEAPLQSHATYTIHMGGGITDVNGRPADCDTYGPMLGGQWIQGGMMSGIHGGGMGWDMMGAGWRRANGSYGMAFTFTTE